MPQLEATITRVAVSFTFSGRMFVIGRGVEFATAREIALKLLETCRVAAEPLTATDLAHGPVAALDALFPVWTIASGDEMLPAVLEGARACEGGGRDPDRERERGRVGRRRRLRPLGACPAIAAARAAAVGRTGTALRLGARAHEGPRSRRAARSLEGHARPLSEPAYGV